MRRFGITIIMLCCCAFGAEKLSMPNPAATNAPAKADVLTRTNVASVTADLPASALTTNDTYKIPELQIIEFPVPLTAEGKFAIVNSKNPPVEFARAAIAVPRNFDPKFPTPVLLVSGTSDGKGSSIAAMHSFTNMALRMGWVVIAADGPNGKPPNDNPQWRWAMASALLEHMHKSWPQSRRWPIAAAGVSGGGKWSGVIGAVLAKKGYNLIGVFMCAVNQDFASESAKLYAPAVRFKRTPFFLSSGTSDKIATPEHHNEVKESLLHHGFSAVRLETFEGGHDVSDPELRKALNWFVETYAKN